MLIGCQIIPEGLIILIVIDLWNVERKSENGIIPTPRVIKTEQCHIGSSFHMQNSPIRNYKYYFDHINNFFI